MRATLRAAAAILLIGCGGHSVDGPRAADPEVAILLIASSPGVPGWPVGDVLSVEVTHEGASAAGARVLLDGAEMRREGDTFLPEAPFVYEPASTLVVEALAPGFARRDTLLLPHRPEITAPAAGADRTRCASIAIEWTPIAVAAGGWIVLRAAGEPARATPFRDASASAAVVPASSAGARQVELLVLCVSSGVDAWRPDRPLGRPPAPGVHTLWWSDPVEARIDASPFVETSSPDSLSVTITAEEAPAIAWSPDTVAVNRITVHTQFLTDENLIWEIVSEAGLLPPIGFGALPAGARPCVPSRGEPPPLVPGAEYVIELEGRRHATRTTIVR
jgi:hypothetical protein